jgi:hypothetical protein
MLVLFLVVVALVIVLWVTGVFNGSGFSNNNRSGFRSRFGALGVGPVSSYYTKIRLTFTYTNPDSFGFLPKMGSPSFKGLVLYLSSDTGGTETPTSKDALSYSNVFFTNRYRSALSTYYGVDYTNSLTTDNIVLPNPYRNYLDASLAVKMAVQTAFFNRAESVPTTIPGYTLINNELSRLNDLVRAFASNGGNDNVTNFSLTDTEKKPDASNTTDGGGLWNETTASLVGSILNRPTIKTVKKNWLDKESNIYTTGLAIINNILTITTDDELVFPLNMSDVTYTTTTVSGYPQQIGAPSGLEVVSNYIQNE